MKNGETKEFYESYYILVKKALKRKIYRWRNELLKATLLKDCTMKESSPEELKIYLHQCKKQLKKSIKEYKEYVKIIKKRLKADGEIESREIECKILSN